VWKKKLEVDFALMIHNDFPQAWVNGLWITRLPEVPPKASPT